MESKTNNTTPEETISDEKLKEVCGGNKVHERPIEQIEAQESSKGIDIQKIRLDELDRRDSSK